MAIEWEKIRGIWVWDNWSISLDDEGVTLSQLTGTVLPKERFVVRYRDNVRAIRCTLADAKRHVEEQY